MKLILSFLLFIPSVLLAQLPANSSSSFMIYQEDAPFALNEIYQRLSHKLYTGIMQNKISAFDNDKFSHRLGPDQITQLTSISETLSMFDYDGIMHDTVIVSAFEAEQVYQIEINKTFLKYSPQEGISFYLKRVEAEKLLGDEEKWLLRLAESGFDGKLSYSVFEEKGTLLINAICRTWYESAFSGKLKAFRNDSLRNTYSLSEFKEIGSMRDQVMTPVSEGSDEFMVTEVYSPFDADMLEGIRIYCTLSLTNPKVSLINYAYAPAYHPKMAGMDLPLLPMFFAEQKAAEALLSKQQKELLQVMIVYSLNQRLRSNKGN